MMVHGIRVGGRRIRTRLGGHGARSTSQAGTHPARQHGTRRPRHRSGRHRSGRIEAVHGTLMVIRGHHRPEGLRAQRTGHLGRPIVVRIRGIKAVIADGRHEAVELRSKAGLEFGRGIHCVHGVPFAFTPFGTSVLEPHLENKRVIVSGALETWESVNQEARSDSR